MTATARPRRDRTRRDPALLGAASRRRRADRAGLPVAPAVVVAGLAVSLIGLAVAMQVTSYDVWAGFWIAPILMLLALPLANRAARHEGDPRIGRLVVGAAAVKVVGGSIARYWVDVVLYEGTADSVRYHNAGAELASRFRTGDYSDLGALSSTTFAEVLTGQVYAVTGVTKLGGFMVFSFMAFVGLYMFWRAFRLALPHADSRRYAVLVFFFPSILLWSSGTGKDAWMVMALGAAALGLARLLRGHRSGLVVLGLGLWAATVMRPHLALATVVAALAALPAAALRKRVEHSGGRRGVTALLVVLLVLAAVVVTSQAQTFLNLDQLDVTTAEERAAEIGERTAQGGSAFESPNPTSPTGYVLAVVTVLFRPALTEATSGAMTAAAFEGLLLAAVVLWSIRSLATVPVALFRSGYVAFAVTYVAAFCYVFAALENFGTLARQRAQLLPVLFVLLSLANSRGSADQDRDRSAATDQSGRASPDGGPAVPPAPWSAGGPSRRPSSAASPR